MKRLKIENHFELNARFSIARHGDILA